MVREENIKKIFDLEVREKKKTGSGAFHKAGKGVISKSNAALKTPYYYMKTKERNKLNGEVSSYNMYEEILKKEDFEQKDYETRRLLLTKWRESYSNREIMQAMGITGNATFYKMLERLQIERKPRIEKPDKREGKVQKPKPTAAIEPIPQTEVVTEPIITGFTFHYAGTYDAETINKMLTKVQLLLDGEENDFEIELNIKEKKKESNDDKSDCGA